MSAGRLLVNIVILAIALILFFVLLLNYLHLLG